MQTKADDISIEIQKKTDKGFYKFLSQEQYIEELDKFIKKKDEDEKDKDEEEKDDDQPEYFEIECIVKTKRKNNTEGLNNDYSFSMNSQSITNEEMLNITPGGAATPTLEIRDIRQEEQTISHKEASRDESRENENSDKRERLGGMDEE